MTESQSDSTLLAIDEIYGHIIPKGGNPEGV